jgi:hypothetical protein
MPEPAVLAPPRWLALGLAALTLVAVGGLGLLLFRNDLERVDDEEPADVGDGGPAVQDDFERPDAPSLADEAHRWVPASGTWGVLDGRAVVTAPGSEGPAVAVLPSGTAGGVARVTATAVEPGWGFAFRVQDASTFVALVARPESSGWTLAVAESGAVVETAVDLPAEPADGTRIEVAPAGDGVEVSLNGSEPVLVPDVPLADATSIGLVALVPEGLASMAWDDVEVTRS